MKYENGAKAPQEPDGGACARDEWPSLSWLISLGEGTFSDRTASQSARIELSGKDVGAVMGHLGWSWDAGRGQGAAALEQILDQIQEHAANHCGYDFYGNRVELGLGSISTRAPVDGAAMPLMISTKGRIIARTLKAGESTRAPIQEADRQKAAQAFYGSVLDIFQRLGASASVGWREHVLPVSIADSKIPSDYPSLAHGAAYGIVFPCGMLACAELGPLASRKLAKTPLAMAFGPWRLFALLRGSKAMAQASPMNSGSRYLSHGLSGHGQEDPFPCQHVGGHELLAGGEQEAFDKSKAAFLLLFGERDVHVSLRRWDVSRENDFTFDPMDEWLAQIASDREARAISSASSRPAAKRRGNAPRL